MPGRIVEIAEDARHISLARGLLVVKQTGEQRREIGKVPLDEIEAVVANAHGLSYSNNILVALADRGIPFVLCGANHNVTGLLLSIAGHHLQAARFDSQARASKPTNKRLWAEIVKAKIAWQSAVLEASGKSTADLQRMISKVQSGDPTNVEGQAARAYWPRLMGSSFRRDRERTGANSLLNYGYTILRAATARSIVAAGLHPTLSIHHQNQANAMRLADDLMEPFRPIMDYGVWQLLQAGYDEVSPKSKLALVEAIYLDLYATSGVSPLLVCLQTMAHSLAMVYTKERRNLELPRVELPMAARAYKFTDSGE
jgi:CRISPR-associated protein Cas1